MTEKQRALEAVQRLPDDATVEDAIERLCFVAKVQKGLRATVFHGARLFVVEGSQAAGPGGDQK